MSNAYLSPILQDAQFNDDGTFLVGGLIWFYEAGTSTPILAYTTPVADTPWGNPIQLNARGETGGEIWLKAGSSYKIILEGPPEYGQTHGVVVSTFDNISGVNDPGTYTIQNWVEFSGTPTYINGTSFSVVGDARTIFSKNRRVKMQNSDSTTFYGTTVSSSYASGITTVLLSTDYGQFVASNIESVSYGFIETGVVSSIPVGINAGTPTAGSRYQMWINYDGANLIWSKDADVPSSTWPITAEKAGAAAGSTFYTQQTATEGQLGVRFAGVGDSYLYNNATAWGITNPTDAITLVSYNRITSTPIYYGFTLPNPASSKYIKLPNGLIIQFGQGTASAAGTAITFPTVFPTQCFTVVTTMIGNPALATSANNLTTTEFTAYCSSTEPVSYIAYGF
jgi:hypothetical protein